MVCWVHYLVVASAQYRWRHSAKLRCVCVSFWRGRNEINMKLSPQLALQPTLMQAHLNYVTFNSEFDIIGTKGLQQFAFNKYVHL